MRSTPSVASAVPASAAATMSASRRSTRCWSRWTASRPAVGVIVIAATNRPDVLDPALLRPGRFDRQVVVPLPDIRGREQILNVHMRKVPIGGDVKADILARGTPGFSGADLANLVNEAALFAARRSARVVEMQDFEKAKDKIMMGAERKIDGHVRGGAAQHRLSRVRSCDGRQAAAEEPTRCTR